MGGADQTESPLTPVGDDSEHDDGRLPSWEGPEPHPRKHLGVERIRPRESLFSLPVTSIGNNCARPSCEGLLRLFQRCNYGPCTSRFKK